MFVRTKRRGKRTYLQIVENQRVDGKIRQRTLMTLGRLDILQQTGAMDSLMVSMQRFSEKLGLLDAAGRIPVEGGVGRRIGAALLFARLWQELGIDSVIRSRLDQRKFEFDVERAVFLTVLHRLVSPGSDRQADRWQEDYRIEGTEGLQLHHLYRAMAWLGDPLPQEEQTGAMPFAPRCIKDQLEEDLFARRRHLFTSLELVFLDTTTIYFEGHGGATIGQYGHSKDHRPDLRQVVVAVVIDDEGTPVCSEIWPGNTTDVKSLIPVAERLRQRFAIARVCIVADRGMISEQTQQQLVAMGWDYILGVRMHRAKEASEDVLGRPGRYREVMPPRKQSKDPSPLKVKEVHVNDRRYVVCLNEEEARKDAHDREAILASLRDALKRGDKALVGNKGYRRYLSATGSAFAIDEQKVKADARFDGKWVLTTNTDLPAENVALAYKQLWRVEEIFRTTKSLLATRPIFHKRDETIRGHIWCSFLALLLRKELQRRLEVWRAQQKATTGEAQPPLEWADILRDLEALTETVIDTDGKRFIVRSEARAAAVEVFRACGLALPPTLRSA